MQIVDHEQRRRALDPRQSFIVQAPAGSGKTELLTQRYLRLLATVKQPESIIALTFTRKAAFEMRARIMTALQSAHQTQVPSSSHQNITWQLAREALAQSTTQDWNILHNPNRLRILTLDAWCNYLTERMPLISKFGSTPNITEDSQSLYELAAQRVLDQLKENSSWGDALSKILLHLDNNHERVIKLIVNMLQTREQWLGNIYHARNREDRRNHCEQSLKNLIETSIKQIHKNLPNSMTLEIAELANFAAFQLLQIGSSSKLTSWANCNNFPQPKIDHLEQWQGLCELLLTKQSQWRKRVDKSIGFPAVSSTSDKQQQAIIKLNKQRMVDLLGILKDFDSLSHHFAAINQCPSLTYSDTQWGIIEALLEILPLCVAQLQLVFREKQTVDFIEVAQRALNALGDLEQPSDLALQLDSKIQHILVDEFQDTSHTQFHLLECLTAGWDNNDGRSLFLVGDPMQSIYRFRQAEVGLFLHAEQNGIGQLKLDKIQLSTNFRASRGLVDWLNQTFPSVFPSLADSLLGAIPYHKADAVLENKYNNSINYHACTDTYAEAEMVVQCIQQIRKQNPKDSIAILVRARTHLSNILPALQRAEIDYQAVELDSLFWRPIIQDLFALTRALHHMSDRLAWLALLRAPWCGLKLSSLLKIAYKNKEACLWQQILELDLCEIEPEERIRLEYLIRIIDKALQKRLQCSLREWVESTWLALNGPSCVINKNELEEAKSFFNLLETYDTNGQLADFSQFERCLLRLYATPPDTGENSVQIMTIHKAKGLEFDSVIVPGLSRRTAADSPSLLLWHNDWQCNSKDLLLAPIKASHQEQDELYNFLYQQNSYKAQYEQARLLYVALTRAKHSLHLCYTLESNTKGEVRTPSTNTHLGLLWLPLEERLNQECHISQNSPEEISQLKIHYQRKPLDSSNYIEGNQTVTQRKFYPWHEPIQNNIGTFCHRILCLIAEDGIQKWPLEKISEMRPAWRNQLLQLGITPAQVDNALVICEKAIVNTLQDKQGKWILSQSNRTKNEYPLSQIDDGELQHFIIDRTFIDEKGVRWVIDYKITCFETGTTEAFIQQQLIRYKPQLDNYANLLRGMGEQFIHLGLYFPLIPAFESWVFDQDTI